MYPGPGPGPLYTPRTRKYILDNFSPAGLHVLVVDDDPLCLMVLERMLRQCHYKVTTCNKVSLALKLLRENEEDFDLVISDVYMPDEDGFKLLEVIGLELDLPVIMISANGDTSVVMKGILHGACDYLIKPVRIEELRNIWQHIIRRKGKDFHKSDLQGECDAGARAVESQEESFRKRKELFEVADFNVEDISSCPKKARVNWSMHLHQQFVNAVNQLGVDKAVPKKILDIMNVQGLTRENVASHLQKYRLYLKRLSGVMPEPCPVASFQALGDETLGGTMVVKSQRKGSRPVASVKGLNLGAGLGSGAGKGRKVDAGTLKSLSQYKVLQQRQAANRAQVLSAIGVEDPMGTMSSSGGGLLRMASLDLGFLMHSQQQEIAPSHLVHCVDAVDDLATYDFSRSVKLEDDIVIPGTVTGKGIYDLRRGGVRKGLIAHSNINARGDKQLSKINYDINDEVHMLKLDYGGSLSSQGGDLKHGYAGQVNMQGLRESANECKDKVMPSTINEGSKLDYCDAYISRQVNMQALCEEVIKCTEQMTPSSINEWCNLDYVQDNLQPMHEDTSKEVAVLVGESTDDTDSSTKVSYDLSAGSTATEMSSETFSVCSFDALMGDLSIISNADHHLMQQNNSELLDVDKFLQLD